MFSLRRFRLPTSPLTYPRYIQSAPPSTLPKPPSLTWLTTEQENAEAAEWVARFKGMNGFIPRDVVELTFARSSGPGGQNVNKLNTKATLRCPVGSDWIPRWAVSALEKDPHYVGSTRSILVTSSVHRSQSQNIDECLQKLRSIILQASTTSITNPTSTEQKKKVKDFIKADKERWKVEKMKRSGVKQGRSSGKKGGWDF